MEGGWHMPDSAVRDASTSAAPAVIEGFPAEQVLGFLREMLVYRRFEQKAEEAYAIGKIGGFCHLHTGQEGVALGFVGPLRPDDYAISAYREHTLALAKGISARAAMAELYGRVGGCSGGKGGSMHLFSAKHNFMGGWGIVGGQIPLATGFGWASRYRGEDRVCVCFLGDAAVNQGSFHESLNMAAIWKLPVIYVVENNGYGMGTAFNRVTTTPMVEKSRAHGIPAHYVDGQDVLAVWRLMEDLLDRVRDGAGPQFVDAETYRFKGHSMSDPVSGTYRSKEEVESRVREDDPIAHVRDLLIQSGHLTRESLERMDEEVRELVEDAADFADRSPFPPEDSLHEFVYSDMDVHGRLFFDGRGG